MRNFLRAPAVGIEITAKALKLGALSRDKGILSLRATKTIPLESSLIVESFSSPNIRETESLIARLRAAMGEYASLRIRRAGISLPDGLFRVQTFDFDQLPPAGPDRDRLVRWRLEKGAAFDLADTVLRYQIIPRQDRRYSVLACVAKKVVMAQYESVVASAGLEPWAVAPSSFHALNFYASVVAGRGISSYALAWFSAGSYATIIVEDGAPRFYRYREIKAALPESLLRIRRELDDSLHFYTHMDPQQPAEVSHVFLAGDAGAVAPLEQLMREHPSPSVGSLLPDSVFPDAAGRTAPDDAAALGAGSGL